jgi:hypothetical protein
MGALVATMGACSTTGSGGSASGPGKQTTVTTTNPTPSGPDPIRWTAVTDGVGTLVADSRAIAVTGDGLVEVFDRATGSRLWDAELDDPDSQPGLAISDGTLVVVDDLGGGAQGYDLLTGHPVEVDPDSDPGEGAPHADPLPDGYAIEGDSLTFRGKVVAAVGNGADDESDDNYVFVGRIGGLTVISQWSTGLKVVDDDGHVVAERSTGRPDWDPAPVWDIDGALLAMTSDGKLSLIAPTN